MCSSACDSDDYPISGTHVFHAQVQDLLAICVCPERVRLRHVILIANSIVQCPNGISRQLYERRQKPAMALAFPDIFPPIVQSSCVQSRTAAREYGVGEEGHGE